MYHKVRDSFQYSSNTRPQYFQYRIQLCRTPEQTISHSQLFSALETIGKQISNVNVRECLDIFGCGCLQRQRHPHTHPHTCTYSLCFLGPLLTDELNRFDLRGNKKKKVENFRCQSAPSSSDKSHLLAAIADFPALIIVRSFQIIKITFSATDSRISAFWIEPSGAWLTFQLADRTMKSYHEISWQGCCPVY